MHTRPPALIVEDDEVLAQLEVRCLKRIGLRSTSVRTIAEAIEYMGQSQPSLVLVDYHLPDGSAEQLLTWVQVNRPQVPVVVLTGRGDEQVAVRMMKHGARDYLVKDSHTMDALPEVVKRLLESERLQRELHTMQHRYEFLVNSTQDVISVHEMDGTYLFANPAMERVLGFSPGELVGESVFDYIHPDERPVITQLIAQMGEFGNGAKANAEFRVQHKDGTWVWVDAIGRASFDLTGQGLQLVVTSRDVTERKRVEEERQRYTAFLEALGTFSAPMPSNGDIGNYLQNLLERLVQVVHAQSAVLMVDDGGQLVHRASVGASTDAPLRYEQVPSFLVEASNPVAMSGSELLDSGLGPWMGLNLNGSVIIAGLHGQHGFNGLLMVGAIEEGYFTSAHHELVRLAGERCELVLENARLYTRMRESEQRYRGLVEFATDIIWETDLHGNLEFINQAVEQVLGHKRVDLLGTKYIQALRFSDPVERMAFLRALVEGKPFDWEGSIVRPDGRSVRISVRGDFRRGPNGEQTGLVGITRDVTRQREMEDRMRTTQKMEAVGRLAGGIAHDFNNILTTILGTAQMLRDEVSEGSRLAEDVDTVILASQKAATLVKQLLAFGRRQSMALTPVQINQVIRGMVPLIRRSLAEDVEIVYELDETLPFTKGDLGQLEQVLLNLCVNAKDAMPFGGKLTIQTRAETVTTMSPEDVAPGKWVVLSVKDTGVGMDVETRQRCFEPYFSTKIESGRGSGLGLATVHGIITQHKGIIHLSSKEGQGTTFDIYLPVHDSLVPTEHTDEPTKPSSAQKTVTVLVAEDEEPVRRLIHRILTNRGFQVLAVEDGHEAVTMVRAHNGQVHLALLDTVMPRMNGIQAMLAIRREFPHVPVLMMSGYAKDVLDREGDHLQGVPFLPKPFSPDELHQRVQDILADVQL